jgi:hypothetical protein
MSFPKVRIGLLFYNGDANTYPLQKVNVSRASQPGGVTSSR